MPGDEAWEALFVDLEAQADALERVERSAEIAERTRIETAATSLVDRLAAAVGRQVVLGCAGGLRVRGQLVRCAPTWLLLTEGGGRETLVVVAAVTSVAGAGTLVRAPGSGGQVAARLGLASALRGIARDRLPVRVQTRDGQMLDGTIDRVGADFVELAVHPAGEWRRGHDVRGSVLLAFSALAAVQRSGLG